MQRTLIWDLPTRLFHWTLATCFLLVWLTGDADRWRAIHVFVGYLMLGLVGFRLVWGVVGSHFSRFANFWFGPGEAFHYLKQVVQGNAPRHVGHNPTGSLAIYLLLVLTVGVGSTGIMTLGGDEQQGMAAGWFTFAQIQMVKEWHELAAIAMLLIVGGHMTGVLVESVLHRENLARSMINGFKMAAPGTLAAKPHRLVAGVMLLVILGSGGWWFDYAIDRHLDQQAGVLKKEMRVGTESHVKFVGAVLPDNELWRDECGSCHSEFYPSLLPSRSWQKILAEQHRHFGKDLMLDVPTVAEVLTFLNENSADKHLTEAAFKIEQSISKITTPLRVTETPYWLNKHREIGSDVWTRPAVSGKKNCVACHEDAKAGTYEDAAMHIPEAPAMPKPAGVAAPLSKP
ncbi:MAG: hypothetical protein A2535_10200 [Burkholderiales bacterium RIFOXYD2_FULL_59_8]|nr:MAG: hypothetical protein A2535_10200 [Burkholderiales bacterium RIFOXYD2_FULL_59_8]